MFRHLREDILNGVYKNHEELREVTIGEELGVSRTPVREALRQLELEGLVTIIPNKGAYVTAITRKDVKDIYKIRSQLEGLCANWATKYITDAQIEELEEVILLSEFHLHKKGSCCWMPHTISYETYHPFLTSVQSVRIPSYANEILTEESLLPVLQSAHP